MTPRLQPNGRLLCPGCNQRADADATGQIPSGSPVCTCCDQPFPDGEKRLLCGRCGDPTDCRTPAEPGSEYGDRPCIACELIESDDPVSLGAQRYAELLERHDAILSKYRSLRRHVRKDGVVKLALPRHVAEAEAIRLSEKYGKPYTAYGCSLCNGQYHTGTSRDEFTTDTTTEDTPAMPATDIKISGASDDLVYVEPALSGLDEIGCYDSDVHLVVHAGEKAARVVMRYGKHGSVWSAEIAPLDDDHPMPEITVGLGGRGYSAEVSVVGATSIVREVKDRG